MQALVSFWSGARRGRARLRHRADAEGLGLAPLTEGYVHEFDLENQSEFGGISGPTARSP